MILTNKHLQQEFAYYEQFMQKEDSEEILKLVSNKETRIKLFRDRRDLFFKYYFPHFCKYNTPPFHLAMFKDLDFNGYHHLVWEMFRESAKTSLAKVALVIHAIVYGYKKNIFYVCNKKDDAQHQMLDIALELQTNEALIEDFGHLFYSEEITKKKSEKKGASDFVTENGVSVRAASTGQSLRGQIKGANRPDLLILDDFENNITIKSSKDTRAVINFIEECRTGIDAVHGDVIYLCNKISETGSVAYLEDMASASDNYKLRAVPIEIEGKPVWKDRDVMTIEEAKKLNDIIEKKGLNRRPYISIEQRKIDNPHGRFEQEYMNIPISDSDRFFPQEPLDESLIYAKGLDFRVEGNWKIWKDAEPGRYYIIAADISQGFGRDSSVIQVLDYETMEQVAEFEDNNTPPEILAEELMQFGFRYNTAYMCWENNSIGEAIKVIVKDVYPNIHMTRKYDGRNTQFLKNYGFNTNGKTKPMIMFELRDAIHNNFVKLNSTACIRELKGYSTNKIDEVSFDPDVSNHFDRVMALAIAYHMRKFAIFTYGQSNTIKRAVSKRRESAAGMLGGLTA